MAFFKNKKKADDKRAAAPEKRTVSGSAAALHNPKILEVNLIKDEAQVSFDWAKNLMMFGLVLIIGALLIGEVYFALDNWEESETVLLKDIEAETDRLNADIVKLRNESADALSYQDRAQVFSELLDNHVYWTKLLGWVEKNTLNTVQFTEFNGDLSGAFDLNATALTYSEISWQAGVFLNSPEVKQVSIRQASTFEEEVAVEETGDEEPAEEEEKTAIDKVLFGLKIDLKPEIFRK